MIVDINIVCGWYKLPLVFQDTNTLLTSDLYVEGDLSDLVATDDGGRIRTAVVPLNSN